MSFYIKTSFY